VGGVVVGYGNEQKMEARARVAAADAGALQELQTRGNHVDSAGGGVLDLPGRSAVDGAYGVAALTSGKPEKERQIDRVLEAYRSGCQTTKQVSEQTGLALKTCSAYTSVLVAEGLLVDCGTAKRWSPVGAAPRVRVRKSKTLDEPMPWPDDHARISWEDAFRRASW
jgi:hypothetical protein